MSLCPFLTTITITIWAPPFFFSDGGGIGMADVNCGYVYGSKSERRCLFSCQHLDNVSYFLFCRMFCDR